ncbi:uncharacterized protein LOC104885252 [Beta vulgaris subsp. vulgaris]|uniref:uncharacterized protein LOC104885252 n=1 Tax=Beta vulgaris subsp. vulgaris TaxID=3555 RepID=UPI0025498839|nr:uncharacterized protein LOC104885252 [Beta vulgaris subsp. vulgaris]
MASGIKNWWTFARWSDEYEQGVDEYIEKTFATKSQGDQICCPCEICHYRYWHRRNVVRDHIICNGFVPRLDKLFELGEDNKREKVTVDHNVSSNMNDDIEGLLHDTLREGPNEDAKNFFKLIEEGQQELYPGCKKFSKLSFTIRLFLLKVDYKLTNVAFGAILELFREVLPDAKLPSSFYEAKNSLKALGLDYSKIDACPNDCMLYWEEHADATHCHVCKTPRWKLNDKDDMDEGKTHRVPAKILRYFPVKKRLQKLFMCPETARHMTWHANGREKDGYLQHPADGQAWKDFNREYPKFAEDPRNLRLGLATDGFNPFHSMSIVHSTWPVILINYNLPPWMLMKHEFLMLSLLIPGPLSPGNDIDVYLQPLIKDLKDLWEFGLETYDASCDKRFDMHVALISTISDFPAYAMLSGWSTKGEMACLIVIMRPNLIG